MMLKLYIASLIIYVAGVAFAYKSDEDKEDWHEWHNAVILLAGLLVAPLSIAAVFAVMWFERIKGSKRLRARRTLLSCVPASAATWDSNEMTLHRSITSEGVNKMKTEDIVFLLSLDDDIFRVDTGLKKMLVDELIERELFNGG